VCKTVVEIFSVKGLIGFSLRNLCCVLHFDHSAVYFQEDYIPQLISIEQRMKFVSEMID